MTEEARQIDIHPPPSHETARQASAVLATANLNKPQDNPPRHRRPKKRSMEHTPFSVSVAHDGAAVYTPFGHLLVARSHLMPPAADLTARTSGARFKCELPVPFDHPCLAAQSRNGISLDTHVDKELG